MFGKKYLSPKDAGEKIYKTLQAYKEGNMPLAMQIAANEGRQWEQDSKHNIFHARKLDVGIESHDRGMLINARFKDCAISFTHIHEKIAQLVLESPDGSFRLVFTRDNEAHMNKGTVTAVTKHEDIVRFDFS